MKEIMYYFRGYILCLQRPRAVLDWKRLGVAPYEDVSDVHMPELTGQIGISWVMAIIQGLGKLLMIHTLINLFVVFQGDGGFLHRLVERTDGLLPYYVMLFSISLDLIFFPIITLVKLEVWNLLLRFYGWAMGVEERDVVSKQICEVALSSHFFLLLPVVGDFLQRLIWYYLVYVGCRHQMGATRGLAAVILLTPLTLLVMAFTLFSLFFIYLFSV